MPSATVRKDVVSIHYDADRKDDCWSSTIALGSHMLSLGEFATISLAMNAAVKVYYEQRPTTRRRGRPRKTTQDD